MYRPREPYRESLDSREKIMGEQQWKASRLLGFRAEREAIVLDSDDDSSNLHTSELVVVS